MKKPRVILFATARSPYNDFLFTELAKQFDLLVYVRIAELASHPWALAPPGFECRYLKGRLLSSIWEVWKANFVVVVGWDHWSYLLITLLLPSKIGKAFWTDTPDIRSRGRLHHLIRALVVRFVSWRFDSVWATGTPGCRAVNILGCPQRKIISFPFYIDNDGVTQKKDLVRALKFRQLHSTGQRIIVMCVGRLVGSKRFEDTIRAMQYVDESVALWIAGTGPEQSRLLELCKALGLEERVCLLGWLQPSEIADAVDASDIFVHPADFDPFPTVVLDAMARSKPIIGTATSGSIADRVIDGWNGFIVPNRDTIALAERINLLARNQDVLIKFSQRARETACRYPISDGIAIMRHFIKLGPIKHSVGVLGDRVPAQDDFKMAFRTSTGQGLLNNGAEDFQYNLKRIHP